MHVQCKCGNKQVVFGDAKSKVNCLKCGVLLVEPTGGRAKVNYKILEVLA